MSKKSNKANFIGNRSAIANAMYDAQKKEITSSMVLSLSFIAAGLIVAAIGIFQYFHIKKNLTDASENIDALAWIVIAGVGLLVGIIGLVSIMKSMVSLGQIGSWAKEAESHASPFQAQKLHKKVAAMNQAQSMDKPATQGMAEDENGQKSKLGFFKRAKENKSKQNSEDLYYKYNPQEKKQSAPGKSAPMMEQKFDYGIDEYKKLTFADEFLKKNKRDPFAQYRKDLGIEEEPEKEVKKKPKFIVSNSNQSNNTNINPSPEGGLSQSQTLDNQSVSPNHEKNVLQQKNTDISQAGNEESDDDAFDFALSYLSQNSDETQQSNIDFIHQQPIEEKTFPQEEISAVSTPYGVHNEADDDIFFSLKSSTVSAQQTQTPIVQQSQPKQQQPKQKQTIESNAGFIPNLAAALDKASPKSKTPAPPTVVLDLDYKKKRPPEEYDFSLFEEISPDKNKQQKAAQNIGTPQTQKSKNDYLFYGADPADINQKTPDSQQSFISDFVSSIENQNNSNSPDYSLPTQTVDSTAEGQLKQSTVDKAESKQQSLSQKPVLQQQQNNVSQKKTTTPPKSRFTKSRKNKQQNSKKSFSEVFLSKNGNIENSNSEIVKNGTRSQRKFVDASEYDEWSCPQCGKVNQEYVGVCACGTRKPRPRR